LAKDEHRDAADGDSSESTHAADEPTAVWDFEALRKAGLSEIAQLPEQPETGPATPADGMAARASIIVDGEKGADAGGAARAPDAAAAPVRLRPASQAAANDGLSWVSLIALAALCGALAYAAIRFLR
jgi:hypothetical protein